MKTHSSKCFQSGFGCCNKSTDYAKVWGGKKNQRGGSASCCNKAVSFASLNGGKRKYKKTGGGKSFTPGSYSTYRDLIPNASSPFSYKSGSYTSTSLKREYNNSFIKKNFGKIYDTTGGKKKSKHNNKMRKKTSRSKKQRGAGQTGMPTQWYDPTIPKSNASYTNGMGVHTSYGASNPRDVGRGNLAPFHQTNTVTGMKTGGRRKGRGKVKKGGFTKIGDSGVTSALRSAGSGIEQFRKYVSELDSKLAAGDSYGKNLQKKLTDAQAAAHAKSVKAAKQSGGFTCKQGRNLDSGTGPNAPRWPDSMYAGAKKKRVTKKKKVTKTTAAKKKAALAKKKKAALAKKKKAALAKKKKEALAKKKKAALA